MSSGLERARRAGSAAGLALLCCAIGGGLMLGAFASSPRSAVYPIAALVLLTTAIACYRPHVRSWELIGRASAFLDMGALYVSARRRSEPSRSRRCAVCDLCEREHGKLGHVYVSPQ